MGVEVSVVIAQATYGGGKQGLERGMDVRPQITWECSLPS